MVANGKTLVECHLRILCKSYAHSARGEPAVEVTALLIECKCLASGTVEQDFGGSGIGFANVVAAETIDARSIVALRPPVHAVLVDSQTGVNGTVGYTASVVAQALVAAHIRVGVGVDARFLFAAVAEVDLAETCVAVVVEQFVAHNATRERVAESVTAHVADNEVGISAVGAHNGDFAVAEHTVVIHLVAEILATVEDIDVVEAF